MSNRLKIKFLGSQRPQETTILNALTEISPVSIRDIFMAQSYATIILTMKMTQTSCLQQRQFEKLEQKQLKAVNNNNFAEKTVFVTTVRPFVANYTVDQLKTDINANNNVKVAQLFIVKRKDYVQNQPV